MLQFFKKDPEKCYRANNLWVPKTLKYVDRIKESLLFTSIGRVITRYRLWSESSNFYIFPRETSLPVAVDVIDIIPPFERMSFSDNLKNFKNKVQENAWKSFEKSQTGVLVLACGGGKTVLACKKISQRNTPALIVVNNTGLIEQWRQEIIKWTGCTDIGIIQGKNWDWHKPIALATVQTLSRYAGKIPPEARLWFGTIIFDEVHHIAARIFKRTASMFWGQRFGLSATPERADSLEGIYYAHIGRPFHVNLEQELNPVVYFVPTRTRVNLKSFAVRDVTGELSIPKLWKVIGKDEYRNDLIVAEIRAALEKGRKVLALSHSREHVHRIADRFPEAGIITRETKQDIRTRILREKKLTCATMGVAKEGLDAPILDTIFFMTPFTNWNDLRQSIGRALRDEYKKQPLIVIFNDVNVRPLQAMCNKMRRNLIDLGYKSSDADAHS